MTRRRHRRRRLDGPPPPTASLTRVLLALYSIPLFYPNSAGSAVGVAAAAVAAGTEATPLKDKQQPDAADPAARDLQRQQDPAGRSSSGGVIGGGGQQEQSVDSRSGETEEVPGGERTSIEEDLGQEGRQQRHGKPGDRHGKNEARLSQHQRDGGSGSGSSSSGSSSSGSSGRKGREEDETRTPQAEHTSGEKDCSKDTSTVNDGARPVRPPLLAPHAQETEATPEALASAAERGASNGEGCGVGSCGGDGGVDAASSDDRWAAQTLGVPMALHHPLGEMSDALGFASARTTLQTIGGALPRVLEDSAWCDEVEETECFSAPSATKRADEERDETGEEEVIVGGFASDGLGFDSSRTAQTIGGTLPRILEDSAWCAGEEDCSSAPSVSVGGEKKQKREETREEKVAAGPSASNGLGFDSTRTVQTIGGALPRIVEDSAWCAGEEDRSSASADRERGQTREVQPALCASPSGEGEACEAREGYGASTDEGVQAFLGQGESTLEAGADGKCDGEHPGNGGSQAGRGAAAEGECKQNFPAVERQSPQEQRGPLVKGQGANIKATLDPRHGGEGDRADYGKAALDVEGTAEAGGQQGGGEEGVEGFLVTVLGKAWNSWKIIVCALVVGAVTLGMYLQGSLSRWLPFLHGSSRRGWLSDLDSVIANARSRTGTFCSPGGLSGDAAADDSDLPDLVSADGGDDGRIGDDHGPRNASSDAGEAPLMWDTRPKPDDYLVFHPVLGVVPAGAVRAWGGDGRGGWNGGRVKRRSSVTAVASATNKGGAGALGDGVLSMSSPSLSYSPSTETTRVVGGKPISKVAVMGGRKGKELPPVRNTEEWFRWLASHEAAGAAVAAAVAGVEQARGSAEALSVPGKEEEAAAAAAAAAELAASEALRVRASDFIKPVVVREEEALGRGGPACEGESERGRSGGGQQTVNTNGMSSAGSRKAAATTCAEMFADSQQQPPSADSSLTPAAIGLQLGIGSDELVCSTGGSCTSVSGIASTEEGLSGPGSGTGDDGEDSSLSFGGGGAGAGGSGGRTSSSEDGSS
ncbi:unnamed protein product, partial [Scytosiphon promiscuus]